MSDDDDCPLCGSDDVCGCGQVFRYRITEVWGDAPEQITELVGTDSTVVDGWRGRETTWEVFDFTGTPKPKYGWAGEYVGLLAAVSDPEAPQ